MNELINYLITRLGERFLFWEYIHETTNIPYIQVYTRSNMEPFIRIYKTSYVTRGYTEKEFFIEITDNNNEKIDSIHRKIN